MSLPFEKQGGNYPGMRTPPLHTVDPQFFDHFCNKLFSIYYRVPLIDDKIEVSTMFQLTEQQDPNPLSPKNKGWVHVDGTHILAGVIYLTPNAKYDTGTSFFKMTTHMDSDKEYSDVMRQYYSTGENSEGFDKAIEDMNSHFTETLRVHNLYNRMIAFDGQEFHAATSYNSDEPRLTQVFFVSYIGSTEYPPLKRYNI